MFHLLPVAINFTLLGLYVRQILWVPPGPTTNVSNALQFAAKVHETLMIASLGMVLLHHIRYKLLSSDGRGLLLGLITSPFRLLDISYLWSREFSAACRDLRGLCLSDVISILIHLFLFILAAVLGPASAISMLPRLGERQIAKTVTEAPFYSIQTRTISYYVYLGGQLSDIFPQQITANFNPKTCDYSSPSQSQTKTCPRMGLTDILNGMLPSKDEDLGSDYSSPEYSGIGHPYNITVQAGTGTDLPARVLMVFQPQLDYAESHPDNRTFQAVVDVTTSTDAILHFAQTLPGSYLLEWDQIRVHPFSSDVVFLREAWPAKFTLYPGLPRSRESSSFWKQPLVSCLCLQQGNDSASSEPVTFTFVQPGYTKFARVTLDSSYLSLVLNDRGMGFIDISQLDITPNYSPSAAFAFRSPSITTLCLVKAKWIASYFSGTFSPYHDGLGYTVSMGNLNWTAPDMYDDFQDGEAWFNNADDTETIHLDLDWLAVLDHGTGIDETSKNNFFESVRRVCSGTSALDTDNYTGKHADTTCMASGFGLGIAEGLSKVPYKSGIYAVPSMEQTPYGIPAPTLALSPWISSTTGSAPTEFVLPGNWSTSTLTSTQIMMNSTRLDFIVTQQLYGYSFNSITTVLASMVLFLYVATVLVHVSVMAFGTSWSSRAWRSLGEFYVLALQSPTPTSVLDNTGGGVKVSKTWQARASVLELQHGKRVGIVIAEPGRVDSEEGSVSKVRPDWKYS